MSKRLNRITTKNISSALADRIGLELNAVAKNGNIHFGKLHAISDEYLTLLDARQHTHQLRIHDLFEVVYDAQSI